VICSPASIPSYLKEAIHICSWSCTSLNTFSHSERITGPRWGLGADLCRCVSNLNFVFWETVHGSWEFCSESILLGNNGNAWVCPKPQF
jgi:hypothetical protein